MDCRTSPFPPVIVSVEIYRGLRILVYISGQPTLSHMLWFSGIKMLSQRLVDQCIDLHVITQISSDRVLTGVQSTCCLPIFIMSSVDNTIPTYIHVYMR